MIETKLLLVDDEEAFVATMAKRLTHREINVSVAYSGEESLSKLAEHPDIDVVILDVLMPGMDGIATLKEIKKAYPLVEVIMLTGHATVESAIEGMKHGAYDYLMKPCEMDVLVAKVREAKARRQKQLDKILEVTAHELRGKRGL